MSEFSLEFFDRFYTRLGQLAYIWGQIDFSLAAMVHTLYFDFGNPPGEEEVPVSFKRRMKYIRASIRAVFPESEERDQYLDILAKVSQEVHTRNHLIHGAITSVSEDRETIEASAINQPRSGTEYLTKEYSLAEIQSAADRVLVLTTPVQVVVKGLIQIAREQKEVRE